MNHTLRTLNLWLGVCLALLTGPTLAEEPPLAERLKEGWTVFNRTCTVCHWPGVGGAPRIGDKEAWKERIDSGIAVLYQRAINGWDGPSGKRMPARGGNWNLTDDQVMAAVDYMIHNSQ
jgi:cytochrome c5